MLSHKFSNALNAPKPISPFQKIERNKLSIRNSIGAQIREYEKEFPGQSTKETMLKICVKEQQEQEDKLETVSQKIAEYKGNADQGAKTVNTGKCGGVGFGVFERRCLDIRTSGRPDFQMIECSKRRVPKPRIGKEN